MNNEQRQDSGERKKRQMRQFYSLLAATLILIVFFILSFLNSRQLVDYKTATNELTLEKGYAINNNSTENLTHMLSWYYLEKNKVNKQDLENIQPYILKLYESNVYMEEIPENPHYQLLLEMSDERVAQLAVSYNDDNRQYILVDVNTKQSMQITIDEAMDIDMMIYNYADRSLLSLIKIVLSGFWIVLGIVTMINISPKKKEKRNAKTSRYYFFAGIFTFLIYIFVCGFSLYFFNAYNGLFIASVMTALLVLKTFTEYFNGRFERSVVEVPLFFVLILVFTLIKYN